MIFVVVDNLANELPPLKKHCKIIITSDNSPRFSSFNFFMSKKGKFVKICVQDQWRVVNP